jgi:anti-sigma regulatory factor (Ser/Thr protein kinase)
MAQVIREYSSDTSQVADMRALLAEECRREWGDGTDEAVFKLQLALSEAVTNIVRHAYQGQPGQPIQLVLETTAGQACLTLYYHGRTFDPETVAPPRFDGSKEGGFGVYLMKELTDQVTYFRTEDGRCAVRLLKNRAPAAGKKE